INAAEGIDASDRKNISNVTAGQYLVFNLNVTGKNLISIGNIAKFALREGHDENNVAFSGSSSQYNQLTIRSSEYSGTASKPVLEVTYTVPPPVTVITYA